MPKKKRDIIEVTPTHYFINGVARPRVSTLLSVYHKAFMYDIACGIGLHDAQERVKSAADIGKAAHNAIEMYNLGKLSSIADRALASNNPVAYGHLQSYIAFRQQVDIQIIDTERTYYNDHYAGTVDVIVKDKSGTWICDIKTGSKITMSNHLQMCAYMMLTNIKLGAFVHTFADGRPARLVPVEKRYMALTEAIIKTHKEGLLK